MTRTINEEAIAFVRDVTDADSGAVLPVVTLRAGFIPEDLGDADVLYEPRHREACYRRLGMSPPPLTGDRITAAEWAAQAVPLRLTPRTDPAALRTRRLLRLIARAALQAAPSTPCTAQEIADVLGRNEHAVAKRAPASAKRAPAARSWRAAFRDWVVAIEGGRSAPEEEGHDPDDDRACAAEPASASIAGQQGDAGVVLAGASGPSGRGSVGADRGVVRGGGRGRPSRGRGGAGAGVPKVRAIGGPRDPKDGG